jgi:hypothetical protein
MKSELRKMICAIRLRPFRVMQLFVNIKTKLLNNYRICWVVEISTGLFPKQSAAIS